MRLDRILANSGYGSRSTVKALIKEGRVSVLGRVVTDASAHVENADHSHIKIDGKGIKATRYLHYILNKPPGYITALHDRKHPTVADFFPEEILTAGIFPVGRLDIDTTGLLFFTTDGTLCHRLTNPKWHVDKEYYFEVSEKYLDVSDVKALKNGICIGKDLISKPADLEILTPYSANLIIAEGKYHQVKRMIKALGGNVTKLERVRFGPITLPADLHQGHIRPLEETDIKSIYEAAGMEYLLQPSDT